MSSHRRRAATVLLAVALVLPVAACSDSDDTDGTTGPTQSVTASPTTSAPEPVTPRVSGTVASDLKAPWGLAFLPDGNALVSQRDAGNIVLVDATKGTVTPVGDVPGVASGGEAGLLGLAVSPEFATDRWVYAYLTTDTDNRVVRMKYTDDGLGEPEVLLSGLRRAPIHDGGRIAFGPDGFLYIGTGDAGDTSLAQDLSSPNGKILRVTAEGKPAPGNPFKKSPIYSYGHRNVQGLGWDSQDRLWASEFGQNAWDELNLIEPGKNYGWPVVEGGAKDKRFVDPVRQWPTEEASPSGVAVVRDTVVMAGLRGQRLWVVPVDEDGKAGKDEAFLTGSQGRLRTVAAAPDGSPWVITSNTDGRGDAKRGDDRILRLTY